VSEHLPECEIVAMAEAIPDDPPEDRAGRLRRCAPDCPVLAAAVQRGRELAARYGW
jgi:hypothetical protein